MKKIRNSLLILILILAFGSSFQIQNYFINGFSKEYDESDEILSTQNNPTDSEWYTTWGRSGPDYLGDIAIDSSDNVYVVGVSTDPNTFYQNVNLTKFDSSGALLWTREWPWSKSGVSKAIALDSEGNVYIAGSATDDNDNIDVFLFKIDSSGNLLWGHTKWGPYTEQFFDIKVDSLDNIYIIGTQSWGAGLSDILIYKYHKNGYVIWKTLLDYSPTDIGLALAIDTEDDVIVTGYVSGSDGSWADIFLAKYDGTTGINQWYKTIDYGGFDAAYSIAIDSSNNIFLAGLTQVGDNMDMLLVRCDATGNPQWYRTEGKSGFDIYYSIGLDSSDDIYLMGIVDYPSYPYSVENADLYLEKYSNSGVKLWSRIWGENTNEIAYGMALDSTGNIYCCGLSGKFVDNSIDMLLVKFISLSSILIDDLDPTKDWAYIASHYMWCSGSGTSTDPYIISDLYLNGKDFDVILEISNSYSYFTVTRCNLILSKKSAIKMLNVVNGDLIGNILDMNQEEGIRLENCGIITIRGNSISYNKFGLLIFGSHSIHIGANIADHNSLVGISLKSNSDYNTISDNQARYNELNGIECVDSSNNNFIDNFARSNDYAGMYFLRCTNIHISGNRVDHNYMGIKLEASDNNIVRDNIAEENENSGIVLEWYSDTNTIDLNQINRNDRGLTLVDSYYNIINDNDIAWNAEGIKLISSVFNDINVNLIDSNTIGIYISSNSYNNKIQSNTIRYNNFGIRVDNSDNTDILYNNLVQNCDTGIYLRDSDHSRIHGNDIECCGKWIIWPIIWECKGTGIYLYYSHDTEIIQNDIFGLPCYGIRETGCNNTFFDNKITGANVGIFLNNTYGNILNNNTLINGTTGVLFNESIDNVVMNNKFLNSSNYAVKITNNSINNDIFYNNFTDNNEGGVQAYDDSGENSWTDEEGVGNYWSDYEEKYPDAEVVDGTYTEPYEMDGDAGVSDAGAQPPSIEAVVEKILFDVNESLGALKSLVENNLSRWKKSICERLVCSALYLTASLIDTYSDGGVVSLVKVCVLKLKIYIIKQIASNSDIFLLCDEILAQIHELKNLI